MYNAHPVNVLCKKVNLRLRDISASVREQEMCNFTERDLDLQAIHDDAATFAQSYFQRTNAWSKMLYFTHQKLVLVSGFLDLNRLFRCC